MRGPHELLALSKLAERLTPSTICSHLPNELQRDTIYGNVLLKTIVNGAVPDRPSSLSSRCRCMAAVPASQLTL
jgi:hypothetical protein